MKKKNSGFTLVELVVVITIMGILAAVIGISISSASSAKARQCAREIDAFISMGRTKCLSRSGEPYIVIKEDSTGKIIGEYYEGDTLVSTDTLGSGVSVAIGSGEVSTALGETGTAISFRRSTGVPMLMTDTGMWASAEKDITFAIAGGPGSFSVTVVALTGSHFIE